jgi:DNA-directed RNA polymerase subunit F
MVEEKYLSFAEIKDLLEKEKASRPSLSMEQGYAYQHATTFARITPEQAVKLVKELMEIPMMSPANAVKVADLLPTYADDVRAIFAKERFALSKEDMDRVLEIVRQFL